MMEPFILQLEEEQPTDRQQRIGWWRQSVVEGARVLVLGAGALGNEVLKNLALMGVGNVHLADFDTISISNLSRAVFFRREDVGRRKVEVVAERARELAVNPKMRILPFHGDVVHGLGLGIYRRMDLVIGCLDNAEARMDASRKCLQAGIPFVDAGIRELDCRVGVFFPGPGACFECTTTRELRDASRDRYESCTQVMRRQIASQRLPTVQVSSALAASLQSQEVIKLLHQRPDPLESFEVTYYGQSHQFSHHRIGRRRNCLGCLHEQLDAIRCNPDLTGSQPVGGLLSRVRAELNDPDAWIEPGWEILLGGRCQRCQAVVPVRGARFMLYDDQMRCPGCDAEATGVEWEAISRIDGSIPQLLECPLQELGFAKAGVIPIWSPREDRTIYEEISGDLAEHGIEVS